MQSPIPQSSPSDHQAAKINDTEHAYLGPKLRIALLGYRSQPYSGGQGIYLRYLSAALSDMGHQVDVISGAPYPQLDPRVKLIKLPSLGLFELEDKLWGAKFSRVLSSYTNFYEWVDANLGGFPEPYTFGRRLVTFIKKRQAKYDIIHDNQSLSYGLLRLQKMGLATITTIHHPITKDRDIALGETDDKSIQWLIKRWYSFLTMQSEVVKKLNHIITVSESSRRDIATDFGITQDRLDLVYNGIDTEAFSPIPSITRKTNQIIATASADAPLKGLDYLLKAFAQLLKEHSDLKLLVIGKPKPGGHTERLIKQLDIESNLIFEHGISQERIRKLYAESTLAVVPSLYEGFGLPAGEAMSCGVPLVSTSGGSLPEVVGDAGIIVPPANEEQLALAIDHLLKDESLRTKLSRQGRERILEKFSWKQAAEEMTNYYLKVIQHTKSARAKPTRA